MFSVIIPLYNKAPYIVKALHAVFNQTFRDFELIIIDDGSTDNSLEIVKAVCDEQYLNNKDVFKSIQLVEQKNQGVSVTRNNGVKLSKFNYIAFLDADDWWSSTFLEDMSNLILEYPMAGIWCSNYNIVKNSVSKPANIGVEHNFLKGEINYFKTYSNTLTMPVWTGASVIKKTIFNEFNGFKSNLKLGEDFDLWIRIYLKYSVVLLNKRLSHYNQDVASSNRAIGIKFYQPKEHVLFQDFGQLNLNSEFKLLFDKLFLYGMQTYYIFEKNIPEIRRIIDKIDLKKYELKYRFVYKYCPIVIQRLLFSIRIFLSKVKSKLIR